MTDGTWIALTGDVVVTGDVRRSEAEVLWAQLSAAETTFVNLEVPLTRRDAPAEKVVTLRADPEVSAQLTTMGVDVATLANNHSLDHGAAGLDDTGRALAAAGIEVVGAGADLTAASAPLVRETASGTVALFGLAATLPAGFAAGPRRPGVAPIRVRQDLAVDPAVAAEQPGTAPFVRTTAFARDVERACAEIAAVRPHVDVVVVGIHWGLPPGWAPRVNGLLATYQRPLGHRLIDAGTDIVAGHHPHVVHPVEVYGDGLVAYSLGNFVFQPWAQWAPEGTGDGAGFETEVPIPPYRNPFDDPAALESTVVLVSRSPDGLTCRFVPTVMTDGTPAPASDDRAATILDRLTSPGLEPWEGGAGAEVARDRDPDLGLLGIVHLQRRGSASGAETGHTGEDPGAGNA